MNKPNLQKVIVAVVLTLVLAGGIFYYFSTKRPSNSLSQTASEVRTSEENSAPISESESIKGDLFALLNLTGSQKCEYRSDDNTMYGTYYISGGKVKADMLTKDSSGEIQMSTLVTNNTVYYWTYKPQKMGFKADMTVLKSLGEKYSDATVPSGSVQNYESLTKEYDYTCEAWMTNESVFAVPTDIEFTDYSAMFSGMMPR